MYMEENCPPNYKKIFHDILDMKYPDKRSKCFPILSKNFLSSLDIIKLNELIFGRQNIETAVFNQKHRTYKKKDILRILEYQRKNNLNNIQAALYFRISRNTLAKWKKLYKNQLT